MKRKNNLQVFLFFCLLALLIRYASNSESLVNINKIFVQPEKLSTKVVLEANSPLPISQTYYSQNKPSTIVIDLNKVKTTKKPQIIQEESPLIKEIKMDKMGLNRFRVNIGLKERVPYRIYSEKNSTVVELNKIQRSRVGYHLDPSKKKELDKRPKSEIFLKKIDISEENDRINIAAKLSGKAISQVFALENPLRLVVDLFDTFYLDANSVHPVKKVGVENVRMAQFQMSNPYTITRIVFDLTEPKYYTLNSDKENLTVSFFKTGTSQSASAISAPAPILPESKPNEEKISIEKVESPEKFSQPNPPLSSKDSSERKEEAYDLKPSSVTPPLPEPAQPNRNNPIRHQEQEEQIVPRTIVEAEQKYTGEIISLRFKDADLQDVILYLGDFAGLNTVFDPGVRGTVTCNLEDIPWDQALDIFLKQNKMGKTIEGNVLRIAPIGVLTREADEQRRLRESKELMGDFVTKPFYLSYSKVKDVEALIRRKVSARGEIIVDERTNTLIVSDVEERIKILEQLIEVFDTPTPQVSIEARIVEATSTFIRNLGIQWGFLGISDPFYGNQTSLQFPNKVLVDGAMIPQGIVTKGIGGPLGGYAINLPSPAFTTVMGLSFANVLDTFRIDMAISALETSGQGQIISAPTVTTQNNQQAEILQGRQIPVQTVANFTVTTRYVNAALELRATPQITAEGTIIMRIEIRNNAADFANLVNGIPPITMQSATTTVMVPDGGTTVIGGIYRTEDSITRERVPFLHKIPILGNLFRNFARTKQNRELLIFITPRIIR